MDFILFYDCSKLKISYLCNLQIKMCDVDSIIQRLLEARKFAKHRRIKTIKTEEIHSLIRASIEVISNESMLLYL